MLESRCAQDPYVIVKTGGREKKSSIKKKTLEPQWNEEIAISGTLNDFLTSGLLLKCFDWDSALKMTKDDPLGDGAHTLIQPRLLTHTTPPLIPPC